MAFFWSLLIRGTSIPLDVLDTSSIELGSAATPVLFTLRDCVYAGKYNMQEMPHANNRRKNLIMIIQLNWFTINALPLRYRYKRAGVMVLLIQCNQYKMLQGFELGNGKFYRYLNGFLFLSNFVYLP